MPEPRHRPLSLLLVDDQAVVRAGCRALLEGYDGFQIAGEADSGESALTQYPQCRPDVVLIELALAGMGGIEAIRRIVGRDAQARVLVFSSSVENVFVDRAMQAGARGYITKRAPPDVLREAVRQVGDGRIYLERDIAQRLAYQRTRGGRSPFVGLSTREFEIFCLLAEGLTSADIANRLSLSAKTIANYSTEIKNKLGVGTSAELARMAIRHGVVQV